MNNVFCTAIVLAVAVSGIAADLDKMRRNIRIQENIINTMLSTGGELSISGEAEGIYIPGFGAVFNIRSNDDGRFINLQSGRLLHDLYIDIPDFPDLPYLDYTTQYFEEEVETEELKTLKEQVERSEEELQALKESEKELEKRAKILAERAKAIDEYNAEIKRTRVKDQEEQKKKFQAKIDGLKDVLKTYLADYGPALELPGDERLMLRGELETFMPLEDSHYNFEAAVTGKELGKVRSGETSAEAFRQTIKIRDLKDGEDMPSDVLIMNNIIKTTLNKRDHGRMVVWITSGVKSSWGSYVDGFGAVFFHGYSAPTIMSLTTPELENGEYSIVVTGDHSEKSSQKREEMEAKIEAEITELLVTYSPTLKSVKPDENIVVAVKLGKHDRNDNNSMMIFNVKKDEIQKKKAGSKESAIKVVKY